MICCFIITSHSSHQNIGKGAEMTTNYTSNPLTFRPANSDLNMLLQILVGFVLNSYLLLFSTFCFWFYLMWSDHPSIFGNILALLMLVSLHNVSAFDLFCIFTSAWYTVRWFDLYLCKTLTLGMNYTSFISYHLPKNQNRMPEHFSDFAVMIISSFI